MFRLKPLILGQILVLLATVASAATLSVHGSTTVANSILTPKKAEIEQASGHMLDIVANGSGRGLADLVAGKADMAMISAPLTEEVIKINDKTPGAIDPATVQGTQIGEARVAFIVHPANVVKSLTLAQVTDILAGKITNWREVGGEDKAIAVVAATPGDGVRSVVESSLLGGGAIKAQLREIPNAPQISKIVAQLPPALGVTAAVSVSDGAVVLKTDRTIGQPLILVTRGVPSAEAAKVIDAAKAAAK
jgi:phosphate transport system substrate-binding protein